MSEQADDALDIVVLIIIVALFIPMVVKASIPLFSGNIGGFNTQIEKTAYQTESEIIPVKREINTDDVLLSLVVADRYTPLPKKLKINVGDGEQEIAIDNFYLENKIEGLNRAKSVMPTLKDVNLDLYVGPSGMRYWGATVK